MGEDLVWWPTRRPASAPHQVTAVTVSYNTKDLTCLLLWSLHRLLDWPDLEVVVVDNGSTDGSAELLSELDDAGICTLLARTTNDGHGPGLNHGLSWLASRPGKAPTRVWLIDSDCVVSRPDTLHQVLAQHPGAAVVGESQWDRWREIDRVELFSLLLDPALIWQPEIGPLADDGDPSFPPLEGAAQLGLPIVAFQFAVDGYIIHRGRGTLAALVENDERDNPLFDWAVDHHEPHYGGVPGADRRYQELIRLFQREVPTLTAAALAAACSGHRPPAGDP